MPPFLDVVIAASRGTLDRMVVVQHPDFLFDAGALDRLPIASEIAVAIDNRFLNFKRLELADLLRARGHSILSVIAPTAVVHGTLGGGVMIDDGAVIGAGATVAEGVCIGARAIIGPNVELARGAWIDPGAIVGANTKVGEQTSIGSGVVVADGTQIGAQCVLAIPGPVRGEIAARTYYHPLFHEPIRAFSR